MPRKGRRRVERREQNQYKKLASYFLECYENPKKIDEVERGREREAEFHTNLFGAEVDSRESEPYDNSGSDYSLLWAEDLNIVTSRERMLEMENESLRAQLESIRNAPLPNPMVTYAGFLSDYEHFDTVEEKKPRKIILDD
jgi:hypothetical protein